MQWSYASTRHGRLHYAEAGSGPALLLLPSAGRSGRVFDGLIQLLAPDFHVIAVDMLGCGNADPIPPGAGITSFAECLVDLLDHLKLAQAHVYGFHIGNKIAAALAAGWPDRVGHVILAGQSHSLIPEKSKREKTIYGNVSSNFPDQGGDDSQNRLKQWAAAYRRLTDFWWHESILSNAHDPQVFEQARLAVLDRIQSQNSVVAIYEAVLSYDLEAGMRGIRAKTLVIEAVTGSEDSQIGRQGDAILRIIPGARLAVIQESEGPKHAVTLAEHYPQIAELVRHFILSGTVQA
jgi:pimeloyl-ACP methyl ester carboxylesterase